MVVASICLAAIALTVWIWPPGRDRPLDRNEVHRLRRFSEKLQREESRLFE
jgi:hypothetical protein